MSSENRRVHKELARMMDNVKIEYDKRGKPITDPQASRIIANLVKDSDIKRRVRKGNE
jgi:hypothetical protein